MGTSNITARTEEREAPIPIGAPGARLLGDLAQDLRLAVRMLRKRVGLTAAVVLTLALGIGANGAIFALVDTVLLRDLPFPDPERLMAISERTETSSAGLVSPKNLADWKERNRTFDAIGGFVPNVGSMVMSGPNGAETIPRQWVTEGIFRALGLPPIVGRTFTPADDGAGAGVAVLSEAFWRSRFASDPGVVGQSIRLDGQPFTVVGVVPQQAEIIGRTSIWALVALQGLPEAARGAYALEAVARLAPGVSQEAAADDTARIAAELAREYPATNEGRGIAIRPLRDVVLGGDLRRTSMLFLGVVGFVLLICFANIANLLSTRMAARANELTVRSVLGADRTRLLRQLWTENFVLAVLGGIAGLVVAAGLLRAAPAIVPSELLPAGLALEFGRRTVVFCGAAAVLVGLLFGVVSRSQIVAVSSSPSALGARTVTDRSGKTRELLVIAQMATAVVLLYCGGLLSRTLLELNGVDPGYRAESVLTMVVDPLGSSYPSPELLGQFYDAVEDEVEAAPGVASAAWTSALPLGASMTGPRFFDVAGGPALSPAERPVAELQIVSGDYFSTLGVPLLTGRPFDDRDSAGGAYVCIVNEALVERHLRGSPAVGETVTMWLTDEADAPSVMCRIVAVAGNTRSEAAETVDRARIYIPFRQSLLGDIFLVVRAESGDAAALLPSVRAAIGRVDREQLVSIRSIMTLEDIGREATARYRFRATLVGGFAGLALLLAMVGLFGVLGYSVQRRWREYGVRMALGATSNDVIRLITIGAARLVVPGALVGVALAFAMALLLGAMLFGVRPFDPATLAAVLVMIAVTAAGSIAGPAWRATRVDPASTLRSE